MILSRLLRSLYFFQSYFDDLGEMTTADLMDATKIAINNRLLEIFNITDPTKTPFTVSIQAEILDTLSSITGTLKLFLGGITAMNILLVTASECTKGIAIAKAIGAKSRDIIEQFLVESIMPTLFGGFIRIVLSYRMSHS